MVSESREATSSLSWGRRMIHDYRVYLLNDDDRIVKATWVQTDTLDSAIAQASTELPNAPLEIWEGPRCLAKVPPRRG